MSFKLTIGSDPELLGFDIKTGLIGSFAGRLGASKEEKKHLSEDVRIQEDNVLIEYDINPHETWAGFNDNMARGISACYTEANKIGMSIAEGVSSHIFSKAELTSFHKSAFIFGCEPDYNALTGTRNPKPKAADPGLRTAGGHIHIGFEGELDVTQMNQSILGVMCDFFLGVPSLLLDNDDRRRELYGKAGACRYKTYGIEYRTLSNFWIAKEENRKWAWDQSHKAFGALKEGSFKELVAKVDPKEIQRVINENDKRSAEALIKLLKVM
ncbi:COOH.NH2 ligase [Proteus phage J3S]